MLCISATLVDKLLPIAARGDIEGALLALLFNLVIYIILGYLVGKLGKYIFKTYIKKVLKKLF